MSAYLGTNQAAWGNVMAFALSMAVPTILLFVILERQFVSALSGGEKA
jgi:multiple sugar transport system permease protein